MKRLDLFRPGEPLLSTSVFDAVLAVLLAGAVLGDSLAEYGTIHPEVLVMALPLVWRRRYPLPVFGMVLLGAILAASWAQYAGVYCIVVSAYSVGAYSRHRLPALAVFLATAVGVDMAYNSVLPRLPNAAGPFLLIFPFWLVGMSMRTRQLRADASESRAARLEREGEQATQMALVDERSRIARELHDVVAHSVSVMLVQAGAARQVLRSSPDEAREALLAVEASGREAMAELRTLLGVLNQEGEGIDLTPQPGFDHLKTLVRRVCDAGLPVEVRIEGQPVALPGGLDLTAYRIVQEALTNSLKHSGLAKTEVVVSYRDNGIGLDILDHGPGKVPPSGPGAGRGLMGMQERVSLYGGHMEAGPRLRGGYAVRVWLPYSRSGQPTDAESSVGVE